MALERTAFLSVFIPRHQAIFHFIWLYSHQTISRTVSYHRLGIAVLWLPLLTKRLNEPRFSPRQWEKWLHATYFGRVYYWVADATVIPIHYNDHNIEVPLSTWYEEGEEKSSGGYEKRSKRWRKPLLGTPVKIHETFKPRIRQPWAPSSGKMIVPSCHLYMDIQPEWWRIKRS